MASSPRPQTYLVLLAVAALLVFIPHLSLLQLPTYWDEMGQFVPAALDLYQAGEWIPHSTTPNSHPPGLVAYLALVWKLFGYSLTATRVAMLTLASCSLLVTFLLAIQLSREAPGIPAFYPPLLLALSPLFFTQSLLAQLDMPAMLFTSLALLMFLQGRWGWSAAACVAAVAMKDTAIAAPLVFGAWLAWRRQWREAALFLLPIAVVTGWLMVLWLHTRNLVGNREYADYNLFYPLHPVRLTAALLRRFYYLFFGDFRWIGSIAIWIAWRHTKLFRSEAWRIAGVFAAVQVLLVTVFGGATLERYLLPVFPVVYIAMSVAWEALQPWQARVSQVALIAGLAWSIYWNPPYPFPFENNMAMVDFVGLQQQAAQLLDGAFPGVRVASAWPFTDAIRRPEFGYSARQYRVQRLEDFAASRIRELKPEEVDVLVVYTTMWDPEGGLLRSPSVQQFLSRFYRYEPPMTAELIREQLHLESLVRFERRGQFIEIYVRPGLKVKPTEMVRMTARAARSGDDARPF